MPTIWMVSAEYGRYTEHFVNGGYAAVGWLGQEDLTTIHSRDEVFERFKKAHPDQTPNQAGANAGQLAKFILNVQPGDYIMTRCAPPTREYRYGVVEDEPLYYVPEHPDGCPFPHRRKVKWFENTIIKENLSIPFQKNLSAAKTLFEVRYMEEFLVAIGEKTLETSKYDPYQAVLDQILQKTSYSEFEYLIGDLMVAMGYEDVEVIGGPRDRGVDVKGVLRSNLVNVSMYVQVKHYTKTNVQRSDVDKLRGVIPGGSQGAIITTSDFSKEAVEAAGESNFAHVSLINGHRLVDLLMDNWDKEPLAARPEPDVPSWHERLGLTQGLVIL